ncbi:MAG: HAAS signaling domain-containing protein [Microbacteriaceae bacterium]
MTDITTTYLLRLSDALADVSRETRNEIVAGVREELDGLDEEAATARIRELGDPEFIAASAREEAPGPVAAPTEAPAPVAASTEPRWLSLTAGILVMIGGAVVPIAGWAAGIVIMWNSTLWSKRQKWVATILPAAVGMVTSALVAATFVVSSAVLNDQAGRESANPLVPGVFDVGHTLVIVPAIVAVPVAFFVGIWLLIKAAKREQPAQQ